MESLRKVILDLEEEMTDQQIQQLLKGANVRANDNNEFGNEKEDKKDKKHEDEANIEVDRDMFIKILSRDLTEEKKK
jgi:hypothetical protein